MAKGIEVRLRPDGTIETETFGMVGEECLAYTEVLEQLLEAQVSESRVLPEMFATERNERRARTEGRIQVERNQHVEEEL